MNKHSIVFSLLLLFTAVLAAGCSLVNDSGAEPFPGTEEANGVTIIIPMAPEPATQGRSFTFNGVPTGTVTTENSPVAADLPPGT